MTSAFERDAYFGPHSHETKQNSNGERRSVAVLPPRLAPPSCRSFRVKPQACLQLALATVCCGFAVPSITVVASGPIASPAAPVVALQADGPGITAAAVML